MNQSILNRVRRRGRPALLALAAAGMLLCQHAEAANKALALGWQGYADTDLTFSEFFSGDHTITLRFMPQYPNAYQGPILAENGTGIFFLGQGDFDNSAYGDNPHLMLRVGNKTEVFPFKTQPGEWHRLALVSKTVGTAKVFITYVDGLPAGPALYYYSFDSGLPTGTMRFGKRTTGMTDGGRDAQFYGLVDDVAVFNRVLSDAEIEGFGTPTGSENGLIAGYTFDGGSQPAKLSRLVSLHNWSAKTVNIAANNTDSNAIPLPFTQAELSLPFKPGEPWTVIQPTDNGWVWKDNEWKEGSHRGYAAFCWDFIVSIFTGHDQTTAYPLGTRMAPFYNSGRGPLTYLRQNGTPGQDPADDIEIKHGPGEYSSYLHFWPFTAYVSFPDPIEPRGQELALAGNTGTEKDHLHFAVKNQVASSDGVITFPVAFSNYELKNDAGDWHRVLRGIPVRSDIVRNPVEPGNRYVATWRNDNSDSQHDEHMEFASFEDFKANYDKIFPQGWRLQSLVVNVIDGVPLYNAVWRPGSASETQLYGKLWPEYKAKYDALQADGWRLHILQSYVVNGAVLYNAVWRKEDTTELPLYGQPYATYRANYDNYWKAGWRLHILQSYVVNDQVLYNAVFRPTGGSETQSYGVTATGLKDRDTTLKAQGWRLSIVQPYVVNGQTLYNGVWIPGTFDDYTVYSDTYTAFRNDLDERRAMGWRLYRLDVYHP